MLSINHLSCFVAVVLITFVTVAEGTSSCYQWAKEHNSLHGFQPQKAEVIPDSRGASVSRLTRRYELNAQVKVVAGSGNTGVAGACGYPYDTYQTEGFCLYNGDQGQNPYPQTWPGWLNGAQQDNCQKKLWAQYKDVNGNLQNATDIKVLDGCQIGPWLKPAEGCPQVLVTKALAKKWSGNEEGVYIYRWGFTSTPA